MAQHYFPAERRSDEGAILPISTEVLVQLDREGLDTKMRNAKFMAWNGYRLKPVLPNAAGERR
jgi:hypothetical protein